MLKILQARLQQYVNWELPDVQAGCQRGRGARDQIANIHGIMEKARKFQKNLYFCFINYTKDFDCVDHSKLWKIQEMGKWDHLTCLLRNLYAGQEATVRTENGTVDWFKFGKGVWQDCITSPGLCKKTTQDQWCEVNLLVALVVSDSMQPHRWQPIRLLRPWDSPG